jgi:hypothetical protein
MRKKGFMAIKSKNLISLCSIILVQQHLLCAPQLSKIMDQTQYNLEQPSMIFSKNYQSNKNS